MSINYLGVLLPMLIAEVSCRNRQWDRLGRLRVSRIRYIFNLVALHANDTLPTALPTS